MGFLGKLLVVCSLAIGTQPLFAQKDAIKPTDSIAVVYKEHGTGIGLTGKKYLTAHYIVTTTEGRELRNSYKQGNAVIVSMVDNAQKQDWISALRKLHVGDEVVMTIPDSVVYKNWRAFLPTPPFKLIGLQVEMLVLAAEDELPPNAVVLDESETKIPLPLDVEGRDTIILRSGLRYIPVKTNVDGDPTYNGRKVDIHYTGYFEDGTIFDASYPNGHPFKFTLTRNEVIDGLDEGVRLMKTGEKYRFIIPPKLGYGKKQQGSIPPNTTLIFDVELISVD